MAARFDVGDGRYFHERLDALDSWIRQHFIFRGEREEVIRTPDFMLRQFDSENIFEGDCDDVSTLTAALLYRMNVPARFVAIRVDGPEFSHVYVEAWEHNHWRVYDATVDPGTVYRVQERMVLDV